MSNYLWLIDEGHGGVNEHGKYETSPEKGKQHTFEDGYVIYEGWVNRKIGTYLKHRLRTEGIDFVAVNDPVFDTPLRERVALIDDNYAEQRLKGRSTITLSIHSNKMTKPDVITGPGQNKYNTNTVWTSKGQTLSDKIAPYFVSAYEQFIPQFRTLKDLADGDGDFEADFYICRKGDGPVVLVESLYFDNRVCAEYLNSATGQIEIANALLQGIKNVERDKPI